LPKNKAVKFQEKKSHKLFVAFNTSAFNGNIGKNAPFGHRILPFLSDAKITFAIKLYFKGVMKVFCPKFKMK